MTLESGFRRIVIVLSIGLFLWGTYLVALLATDAIRYESRDWAMLSVVIAVGLIVLLWVLFYAVRWIARGFTRPSS
jgi:uncharacterized protein HemY